VVEEASVEVIAVLDVVFGGYVDGATGPGIGGVGSHGEVLAWVHEPGVGKECVDYSAEH